MLAVYSGHENWYVCVRVVFVVVYKYLLERYFTRKGNALIY